MAAFGMCIFILSVDVRIYRNVVTASLKILALNNVIPAYFGKIFIWLTNSWSMFIIQLAASRMQIESS
jgi:hypothetical protein